MRNSDIYVSALQLIGENASYESNDDYKERAPYLIAAFSTESAEIDKEYRLEHDLPSRGNVNQVCLPLESTFPCADRFASAAALYVAAMLVIDENMELSDKLFDRYCDCMATIQSEIPAKIEKIAQK